MHWSDELVRGFPPGVTSTVELEVDPSTDSGAAVLLASRIRGIYDAIKRGTSGPAVLEEETEDLMRLIDHLHRVLGVLTAAEDDLLVELRARGVSSHQLAAALETNHRKILRRQERIARAYRQGLNTSALDDTDAE